MSITLVMDQFIAEFPEIENPFSKGLLVAILQLGALIGAITQGLVSRSRHTSV
jgi:hypothetical protein